MEVSVIGHLYERVCTHVLTCLCAHEQKQIQLQCPYKLCLTLKNNCFVFDLRVDIDWLTLVSSSNCFHLSALFTD